MQYSNNNNLYIPGLVFIELKQH